MVALEADRAASGHERLVSPGRWYSRSALSSGKCRVPQAVRLSATALNRCAIVS